jgi:hypothetical protein
MITVERGKPAHSETGRHRNIGTALAHDAADEARPDLTVLQQLGSNRAQKESRSSGRCGWAQSMTILSSASESDTAMAESSGPWQRWRAVQVRASRRPDPA